MRSPGAMRLMLLLLAMASLGARSADAPAGAKADAAAGAKIDEVKIFDSREGLGAGWQDIGWAPRKIAKGAPVSLDLSGRAGWIVAHPGLIGDFGALTFRLQAPLSFGSSLEVGLDSTGPEKFPRVRLVPAKGSPGPDGSLSYRIGFAELNPRGVVFDRIVFRAAEDVGHDSIFLDNISLVAVDAATAALAAPGRKVRVALDCSAPGKPISPLIYGLGPTEDGWWEMNATARRWGGNPTSRYNWENGHAWNAGSDYFFRNANYSKQEGSVYETWLQEGIQRGTKSVLTVPMLGWVAKDTTSYSFPVSEFGTQQQMAGEDRNMGNGFAPDGTPLTPGPPERTSIAAPPEFIGRWVAAIRSEDEISGRGRSVSEYILDNEPTLWSSTHRDVHPNPATYDEILDRTIQYGTAVRKADPQAVIAGFVGWGWTGFYYSALDVAKGATPHADRLAHGNVPLLPWWLAKVREHEKRSGVHLIDILDVHFYPQANGIGIATGGDTSAEMSARRIRSTRALWDPTYVDESWISEPMQLIPRLKKWVDENAPGLGISIGEYNFGAEQHMSGGLALAEALGRFGENGLTSAFYWSAPPKHSPAYWAFRAFRNFDGKGGHFLSSTVPVRLEGQLASAFASRDPGTGHLIAVVLNFDPSTAGDTQIDLGSCGFAKERRIYSYSGGPAGFTLAPTPSPAPAPARAFHQRLAPYSMTVFDLTVEHRP